MTPVWSAAVDPRVLRVRSFPCSGDEPLAFHGRSHRLRVVADDGGFERIRIEGPGEPLRIDVISGTIGLGSVRLEPAIDFGRSLRLQIGALHRVDLLLRGADWDAPDNPSLDRPVMALRAADARYHGASLRCIASVLLGLPDWPGDGEWAKSSTRRLVARGGVLLRADPAAIIQGKV